MKTRNTLLGLVLGLAWALPAAAQDLDPYAYQRWVRQQQMSARMRYWDQNPYQGMMSYSQDYYRGPGGDVVTLRNLPKNARAQGYHYMGSFSATHPYRGK